jgi:hypothetical protein
MAGRGRASAAGSGGRARSCATMRTMRRALGVAFAVAAVAAPCAAAAVPPFGMQALLVSTGIGALFVNAQGGVPASFSWQTCAPDGTQCMPFTTGGLAGFPNGGEEYTSGAPSDVVFVATGDGVTATSPVWLGNVSVVSPPSVRGEVRANSLVTPVVATWSGGWQGDFDQTQLAACVTAAGGECTTLTDPHFTGGCPDGGAVIDPAFAGQYLRVADQTYGPGTVFPAYAIASPYGPSAWPAAPTTAVAIVGRIAPANGPPAASCSVPLQVTVTSRGVARIPRLFVPFTATLLVTRGAAHQRVTRTFSRFGSSAPVTLRLSQTQLRRLGSGIATFEVLIDGTPRMFRLIAVGRRKR